MPATFSQFVVLATYAICITARPCSGSGNGASDNPPRLTVSSDRRLWVHVCEWLSPDRFITQSGDTLRLAHISIPYSGDPDPVKRQFCEFLRHYLSYLSQGDSLKIEFSEKPDSLPGPRPVHLFDDQAEPVNWINEFLLKSGYARFREETDTTHQALCRAASLAAETNGLGIWSPGRFDVGVNSIHVIDVYAPGLSFGYRIFRRHARFQIDFGAYYIGNDGETDYFTFKPISRDPNRILGGLALLRGEWFKRHAGFSLGVIIASAQGGETPDTYPFPIWGLRLGNMERAYVSMDAILSLPAMIALHAYLRYPYAKCWIGVGRTDYEESGESSVWIFGIDVPAKGRWLIKVQGEADRKFRNVPFRAGLGYVL